MYGIIHTALRQMLIENYGEDIWDDVAKAASVSQSELISLKTYDDEVALRLVAATSERLGAPIEQCLELFGLYWLRSFAPENFAAVLDATGNSFAAFIGNLNRLHDRITSTFPSYSPPEFFITTKSDERYVIDYISTRSGFAPFVRGLLTAIGERFELAVTIEDQELKSTEFGEHWAFTISVQASNPQVSGT